MKESFSAQAEPEDITSTYVLVHGAWQAAYVWDAVRAHLVSKGKKVIVVELPAHGADNTPAHTVNLDVYAMKVIEAFTAEKSKVILAGHSMGGMVISAVAEIVPERILQLIYIGAFLPASGQSLADLAFSDPDSKLGGTLVPSNDQLLLDVKHEELTYLFINDGSLNAKEQILTNYRAEPAIPFSNKVTLTNVNFGSVSKVYIKTLQDIVISPFLQNRMLAAGNVKEVHELNSSHSPFLSQPEEVANLLFRIGYQHSTIVEEINSIS